MNVYSIVGLQWGDEGKGKIVDLLSNKIDYVIRYQGGNNAGHTVIVDKSKFILNLLPSGVLHKNVKCIIGAGVVADIEVLNTELNTLKEKKISIDNIFIDYKTHIIMPYHIYEDKLLEKIKGKHSIGTTQRGIGPAYMDKFARIGIRVMDLFSSEEVLEDKVNLILKIKKINHLYNSLEILKILKKYKNILKDRVIDGSYIINKELKNNKNILFEGAQAALLDIDHGTYPYVTSSNTVSGAITTGFGISPRKIQKIYGVFKAYCTRVGEGIFFTEFNDETSEYIGIKGNEYGSTTGRKRRIGWLDLVSLKYACEINGVTDLVMTKLDVLTGIKKIKIAIGYEINNKKYDYYVNWINQDQEYKVIYEELDGWTDDIKGITNYDELPLNAKKYIEFINKFLNININIISTGSERNENILNF